MESSLTTLSDRTGRSGCDTDVTDYRCRDRNPLLTVSAAQGIPGFDGSQCPSVCHCARFPVCSAFSYSRVPGTIGSRRLCDIFPD